jgi:hypothetical protein
LKVGADSHSKRNGERERVKERGMGENIGENIRVKGSNKKRVCEGEKGRE